jgi:hypothetical protein
MQANDMSLGTATAAMNASQSQRASVNSSAAARTRNTNIKATLMVVVICLMAFIKNTIILVSIVYLFVAQGIVGRSIQVNIYRIKKFL